MRIRRRPQIPAPTSSDPAALETGLAEAGAGEAASTGGEAGKGESKMGMGGLHPSIEARGKGGRPWGGDSSVSWILGKPEEGGRRGSWTTGGSYGSCCIQVQRPQQHKGKPEADGDSGTKEESEDQNQPPAQLAVVSTNGLAFVPAARVTANGNCSKLGGAAMKRKNIAWSNNNSRSPSLSSSSVKTEMSNGGRVTSYMHGTGVHQLVKDEHEINGEEQQQRVVNGGANSSCNNKNNGGKRRRSPAVLMEGSRCSRVNGRGWRCCQQTLVGYSLCEHHLGKGRLRSVNSVKCKKAVGGKQPPNQPVISAVQQHHDQRPRSLATMALDDDDDDYEEARLAVGKKHRKRIGTVKARSISSLLGQTSSDVINHAGVVPDEVAPMIATAATLAGLSAAIFRSHGESSATPAAATVVRVPCESSAAAAGVQTAVASLLPTTGAHQEGISAIM